MGCRLEARVQVPCFATLFEPGDCEKFFLLMKTGCVVLATTIGDHCNESEPLLSVNDRSSGNNMMAEVIWSGWLSQDRNRLSA